MILPDYLTESVLIFCETRGIPVIDGNIPVDYMRDVEVFIQDKLKKDRAFTRKKEQNDQRKIKNILDSVLPGFKPTESPIEEFLFNAIKNNKLDEHCRPQFEIGTKRVDFAFPIAKLVVECDGRKYHHTEQWQIEKDQERDKYLSKKGWRVLHFEGLAIRKNIDLCIDKIIKNLKPFLT